MHTNTQPNSLNCSYLSFKYQHFNEDFSDTYLQRFYFFPFALIHSILSLYYTYFKLIKYLFLALVFESALFKFIKSISKHFVLKKYNEKYIFICVCIYISSVQSLSYIQLCDPIYCRMPGFPVHFQLLELAQTHVHWVSDATQPSHSLSSPSPVFNPQYYTNINKYMCVDVYIYMCVCVF